MTSASFRERFDLDITLRDAALDADNRPTRRMIANAAIGIDVEDAYYSVRELKLAAILANDGADDFQRCIYFCLAGRGVVAMLDDLEWLEDLLERRGRVAGEQKRMKTTLMPLMKPYVADTPDGPMVKLDGEFEQGPSWWTETMPSP